MGIVAGYCVPHPPLIIPACGQGQEKGIQATVDSFHEVARRIAAHEPNTIIVTSPHAPAYLDAFAICGMERLTGDFSQWRAPDEWLSFPTDFMAVQRIVDKATSAGVPVSTTAWRAASMDHATFIPLWFVKQLYSDFQLVVLGLSGLPAEAHRTVGRVLGQAMADLRRKAVFIASGDMSHKLKADGPYGFNEQGPKFDLLVTEIFKRNKLELLFGIEDEMAQGAAECGLRSFMMLAGALEGIEHTGELLSYEGPYGVGYAVAAFEGV